MEQWLNKALCSCLSLTCDTHLSSQWLTKGANNLHLPQCVLFIYKTTTIKIQVWYSFGIFLYMCVKVWKIPSKRCSWSLALVFCVQLVSNCLHKECMWCVFVSMSPWIFFSVCVCVRVRVFCRVSCWLSSPPLTLSSDCFLSAVPDRK